MQERRESGCLRIIRGRCGIDDLRCFTVHSVRAKKATEAATSPKPLKYCHVVDHGTADEVAALFHRDAVLLPRYESDERYEGREAVRGWYQHYMENFRSKVRYLRHKIESPVIEIAGNEATSVCYLDADSITASVNEANVAFGRYDDKFIKDGGRWWFKERTIILYYSYPLALYREGRGA